MGLATLTVVVCAILAATVEPAQAQAIATAVIVSPANSQERMTSAQLCDILIGDRRRWADRSLIEVYVPEAGSPEWKAVLRATCRTSEADFRRQVASSRAFGRASRPPQVVTAAIDMKRRVAESPRAIGFVTASELDATVRALAIDGKAPGDPDYPIQSSNESP